MFFVLFLILSYAIQVVALVGTGIALLWHVTRKDREKEEGVIFQHAVMSFVCEFLLYAVPLAGIVMVLSFIFPDF